MRTLCLLFLMALICCGLAADNNPRVIRLKGFHGLAIAPPPLWSPSNLLTLYGWWKPEGLTNATDGLAVNFWTDSSGHGLHMRSAGNPPISTNNAQNGYAGVWFNGVDAFLTNAASMTQTNVIVFVISHRIPATATAYLFQGQEAASQGTSQIQKFYWDTDFRSPLAYAGASMTVTNGPQTNTVATYVVQFATGLGQIWTNGVSATGPNQTCGDKNMLAGMVVGNEPVLGSQYYKGYILEMFCITNTYATDGTVLSDACNYLRAKYAHY